MPITPAHLAAALPLRRFCTKPGDLEALFWGTMVPDIGHILPFLSQERNFAHSTLGLFGFCLPIGLACFCLWRYFWAKPCTSLIPAPWRKPVESAISQPIRPKHLFRISALILLGSSTHLMWDVLSHDFYIVKSLYSQLFWSAFGLAIVGFWLWKKRQAQKPFLSPRQIKAWLMICGFSLVLPAAIEPKIFNHLFEPSLWVDHLWIMGTWVIPSFHLGICIFSALWYLRKKPTLQG